FLLALRALATPVEVMLHTGFGSRFFGVAGAIPVLLIPLFGTLFPGRDQRALLAFLGAYLLMCLVARAKSMFRKPESGVHSKYSGRPYLLPLFPSLSEVAVKGIAEPIIVFACGVLVLPFDEALGAYLTFSALALFVIVNAAEARERSRAADLTDAMIEQRWI